MCTGGRGGGGGGDGGGSSGVGGGGTLNVTDGSSPPRLASTPLPQSAAVDANNTTSYSDGEGEMRAAAERVEQELEDEQGACVIS